MDALTAEQVQELHRDGFLQVSGLIPQALVRRALRAINASLGERGMDPTQLSTLRAQTYCPELRSAPEITDLFNATPAKLLASAAIGAGKIRPITGGQIALRFPRPLEPAVDPNPPPPPPPRAHIDGMYSPTNGVAPGTIANFTALLGVLLSDLPDENAGNFTVWPRSHLKHEAYFREHGPQSLMKGMPPLDIGRPKQITGRAGDMILAHYLLAHGIAPNVSAHVRYAIFFRLTHVDHESQRWESMADAWLQWDGLRGKRAAAATG
jgi:hypothetical protein